jgi:hypothetical protein
MAMPDPRRTSNPHDSRVSSPADDLADVWEVLDTLPPAKPANDLTATTVELVAVNVANALQPRGKAQPRWTDRLVPLAIVLGGLVVGMAAGRISAPDPDARILERLPVIEHLGLLQELGSVEFLETLAEQMQEGQANPPRWLRVVRDPASLRGEAQEFDATLGALRGELAANDSSSATLERRRNRVESLTTAELAALEKSAATFEALTPVDRRELERLATLLADPKQSRLQEAAKLWHVIVAAINPAFRRNIVDMPSAERIEWLARSAGRFDPRVPSGPRDDERAGDRKPPGPRRDGPDERNRPGNWPPSFQRPPSPPANGEPPQRPPPQGPSFKAPREPRSDAPQGVPPEMRAPPR